MNRLFLPLALICLPAFAGDWPQFRGPEGNGASRETNWMTNWPAAGLTPRWRANVGTGFCAVAVSGGRLFTLGNSNDVDTVYGIDARTGRTLWTHSYASEIWPFLYEGGPNATPTVRGGSVYTLGRHGEFICFEAASGRIRWRKQLHTELGLAEPRWGFSSPPLMMEGDRLYLNAGTRGLALDAATGRVLWQTGPEAAAYARPVPTTLEGESALLIFGPQSLAAVTAEDGRLLWEYPWRTPNQVNTVEPLVLGKRVFLSSPYGYGGGVLEMSKTGATEVWKHKEMANHFATCLLIDGYLYGIHGNDGRDARLKCLDFATGEVRWTYEGLGLGSIIAAGARFIALSDRGELMWSEISTKGFEPKARARVLGGKCWTPPALANGLLYCRNARGELVCIDLAPLVGKTLKESAS
jgi:outer membrane protein assembly factor BamB